ncbi:NAD(P)/FAD-dependent oxidoreductase [Paenibacillus apii]|uniref:NAD(P)/FAD-dependent oxidoreductase n=1 Tax=Paenibacillus apii TaxID=1850370 RepID=UPI00143A5C86|nr:NAD(P)/FAD-dependent oxidoreductase [Paenibacillus apii]NJJ38151.1 NAD(P)/FAD-dependent oxidoreductase [Paenibacillus apii]
MSNQQELFDVTIIGGGPAGMYTAFYSGLRDLKTKLIDVNPELGGKMLFYPEKIIWDVGGVTPIQCRQLIDRLKLQALTFDPAIVLGEQVVSMDRQEDGTYMMTTAAGNKHWTRTVILAIGYGIRKLAKLEIEGADRYEISNLHYTVQELEPFRSKNVLISGGGDSAVDWANALEPVAAQVTVVHRREEFGGHEKNIALMKASSVRVCTPFTVSQLHSSGGKRIEEVTICHTETGNTERLVVDAVIVNHGMRSDFGPVRDWGLDMGERNVNVSEKLETNLPGVFAAGDFVNYGSKVRLIAGTFTDAVLALNSAKLYLDPEAPKTAYVSTHNERFKEKNKALGLLKS